MEPISGRSRRLSLLRRNVCDFLHFSRHMKLVPIQRVMSLSEVVAAREAAQPKPGWVAIFAKAFALLAERRPELRRTFLDRPWPRLYETIASIGGIVVEREYEGEPGLLITTIERPEAMSLAAIDAAVKRIKTAPLEKLRGFRHSMRIARLPWPLRRWAWSMLHWVGIWRVHFLGTYGVSVTAGQGSAVSTLIAPWTVTLHYGPFAPDGSIDMRLTFDHRVLDATFMSRALVEMEQILKSEILIELRGMAAAR